MRRLTAWLAALTALFAGACDESTTITRLERMSGFSRSWLVAAAAGALPVEVHGAPFMGVTPAEVVARLRFPNGRVHGTRFRLAEPGDSGRPRLVLVFNRMGAPNAWRDCDAPDEAAPRENPGPGFTVTASFCGGRGMEASGHMEASQTRADDPEAFRRAMTQLFQQILAQEDGI